MVSTEILIGLGIAVAILVARLSFQKELVAGFAIGLPLFLPFELPTGVVIFLTTFVVARIVLLTIQTFTPFGRLVTFGGAN